MIRHLTALMCVCLSLLGADCYKSNPPVPLYEFDGWLQVELDFLYWKPCVNRLDVAAIKTVKENRAKFNYKQLCPKWKPGIRAAAILPSIFYGWDIAVSLTRVNFEDSSEQKLDFNGVFSPLVRTTENFQGPWRRGKEELELFYFDWDLLIKCDIYRGSCYHFGPYFGVAGIFLNQEIEGKFLREGQRVEVEWDSEYAGVGPRMGVLYTQNLAPSGLFFANANFTLLTGNATGQHQQTLQIPEEQNITVTTNDEEDFCDSVFGVHMQVGVAHRGCICSAPYSILFGYEFVNWRNLPNNRILYGNNLNTESGFTTTTSERTVSFHGFFAGASIIF